MAGPQLKILMSVRGVTQHTSPFVVSLTDALKSRASVKYFSWRDVLFSSYDVLHLHWPENLIRSRKALIAPVKFALFILMCLVIRLRKKTVVWTVHNTQAHEQGSAIERRALGLLLAMVNARVFLSVAQAERSHQERGLSYVIKHGHFRDATGSGDADARPVEEFTFGAFGLLRPYKGFEELIESVGSLGKSGATLLVGGRALSSEYRTALETAAATSANVQLMFGHLSEADLRAAIRACELIVLPYRKFENSGAAILALSLSRPILIPNTADARELQDEIGETWISLYDAPLSSAILASALDWVRNGEMRRGPALEARSWDRLAGEYLDVYDEALGLRSGG